MWKGILAKIHPEPVKAFLAPEGLELRGLKVHGMTRSADHLLLRGCGSGRNPARQVRTYG
jgi:hypothetical protein